MENIEDIKKRRLAFMDEAVAYYSTDVTRRAKYGILNHCLYKTKDGKKCMIGRYISDENYDVKLENLTIHNERIQKSIPKNILELGVEFLHRMQLLHDHDHFWNKDGLTEQGKLELKTIIKDHVE